MSMREKRNVTFQEPEIKHAFQEEPNNNNNNNDSSNSSYKNTNNNNSGSSSRSSSITNRKTKSNSIHSISNGCLADSHSDSSKLPQNGDLSKGIPTSSSSTSTTTKEENSKSGRSRSRARSRSWSRFRARRAKSQDAGGLSSAGSSGGGGRDLSGGGIKRERSLVSLVRTGSRNSVRSLVKLFETRTISTMSEGRKSQVILLDERRLDIIIQPKLYASDLLDLVASHFKLREKHYFGLGFFDETYHFNWLQGEKRVLDHEFPKKTGLLVLHFSIRFYVETIGLLRDTQTVELFYLNARQAVFRNQIECDVDTVFELAAHVLQASNGDFVTDEETREELKKLPVIPTSTLKAHPSIGFCEDRVIQHYQKLSGSSRGLAIVNYMTIVERLPTYGIHYYNVKDKKDIPWWLGISPKGIAVYDKNDKTTPRRLFTWKHLENLYYRDKKFSIEVHGPKRIVHTLSSFNPYEDAVREPAESYDDLSCAITDPTTQVSVSRRTFGASNVDVHAWFASTPQLTKCIWSMAVAQHQFYLDRKQSKSQLPTARSMSEIAADLCKSTTSLPGSLGSDLSRSPSSHSLPSLSNSRYDLTVEQSDSLKAERDMYAALLARREALQDALRKKTEELKAICLQEGELTGELPPETPLARGEQPPVFRRRVGTKFSLSAQKVQGSDQLSNELSQMELEVELQGKITSAAQRLASDKTVSKLVRKQRRQSYTKAVGKLKDMEKKLSDMRKQTGGNTDSAPQPPPPTSSSSSSSLTTSGGGGSPSASRTFEDRLGPLPPVPHKISTHISTTQSGECGFEDQSPRSALSPSHSSPQLSAGYAPNGGLPGRGGYSSRGYASSVSGAGSRNSSDLDTTSSIVGGTGGGVSDAPTTLQLAAALRLDGSHDSGFSSANNMYNVHSQRTSHYESTDQLRSPVSTSSEPGAVSPLQSQFLAQEKSLSGAGQSTTSAVPGNEPFQRANYGTSSSGSQGRGGNTMLQYGSLDRKRTPPNIGGVNAGGDHPAYQHYRTEVYRDLSPVRYKGRTLQEEDFSRGNTGGQYGEPVNPQGIILEVAVQHQPSHGERGRSVPPSSSSSSISSSASSNKPPRPSSPGSATGSQYSSVGPHQSQHQNYQLQQQQQQQQQSSQRLAGPPVEQHCYSPRMYESGPHRGAYQDLDISHIHARNVVSAAVAAAAQQEFAAIGRGGNPGFHHTSSQPVFHRRERSLSPHATSQQQQQTSYLQHQPPPSSSDFRHQPQHYHQDPHQHEGEVTPSVSHYSSGYSSPPASLDSPRSIPIQRVDTPPHSNSPSSGPSSPRGVPGAAPSSLVTVSRLQPHTEVTKPYELSDFYRYSEKLRRQRIIDQYQRQLIGNMISPDRMSRSSSPQSVDSDGHSSLSGSASQHSGSASQHSGHASQHSGHASQHSGSASFSNSSHYHPQHPPRQPQQPVYNRSTPAPLNSPNPMQAMSSSQYYHTSRPLSPMSSTYDPQGASHYPEGHMTSSSSSSYTVKSSGPNIHFAVQSSSSFHVQQVHSTAKHAVYTPPQPMACKPIRKPPTGAGLDVQKR